MDEYHLIPWRRDIRDIWIRQKEIEQMSKEAATIWDTYIKSNDYQHQQSPKLTIAEQKALEEKLKLKEEKKMMK